MTLEAAPSAIGWAQACNFVRHLPEDSATWRALHPDEAPWATRLGIVHLLADIFDLVGGFSWLFASAHSKSKPKRPDHYPVPWRRAERQHMGKDAISIADFDSWYYGGE